MTRRPSTVEEAAQSDALAAVMAVVVAGHSEQRLRPTPPSPHGASEQAAASMTCAPASELAATREETAETGHAGPTTWPFLVATWTLSWRVRVVTNCACSWCSWRQRPPDQAKGVVAHRKSVFVTLTF